MKRTLILSALGVLLLVTAGCGGGDKVAAEYAKQLVAVLDSYETSLNKQMAAQQESYRRRAQLFNVKRDEDLAFNLLVEREERAGIRADELMRRGSGNPVALSELQGWLRDYGNLDFQQTKAGLEEEDATKTEILHSLQNLSVDYGNVKSLSDKLKELAKPTRPKDQIMQVATFVSQVNEHFNELECADLKTELDDLQKRLAAAKSDAAKKKLQAKIDEHKARMKELGCDDQKLLGAVAKYKAATC